MSEKEKRDWLKMQIPKMKELWDNKKDEVWEDLFSNE